MTGLEIPSFLWGLFVGFVLGGVWFEMAVNRRSKR